jgi:cell wall assembly regulator SMI1
MSTITQYLNEISEECAKLGINLDANMFPGATLAQVAEATRKLQFDLPGEVIELYVWRNGVRLNGQSSEMRIFPRFYLRPLEQSIQTTQTLVSTINEPTSQWRANWFSLFEDLAGDYLAINAVPNDSDFGKIFSVEELVAPFPAFWSMETMLYSILECYKSGAYFIDEGLLVEDPDVSEPIYRRLNKGLSPCYWKK